MSHWSSSFCLAWVGCRAFLHTLGQKQPLVVIYKTRRDSVTAGAPQLFKTTLAQLLVATHQPVAALLLAAVQAAVGAAVEFVGAAAGPRAFRGAGGGGQGEGPP